ncbi:DUF2007 domain-containing protein [uncultured Draconibacterium sp.]|uniref:putative signal transducing protein n=1 Tax=uncultured Draconibacterium sp. TaxID=1573823 RepID=UPI0025F95FB2|nr:DUF2007 domain-containing protein [uncultured Draconibacterium sp.]
MEPGWEEIYMTAHEYKAEMAKDLLESAGIKTVLLNQHDSAYQNFGEFRLYVAKENRTEAINLIKDLKGE